MYEDYLETFVFKTAKSIAMKLFGRVRKPKEETKEVAESVVDQQLVPSSTEEIDDENKAVEEAKDQVTETEEAVEEENEQMLDEAMTKQREENDKKAKELAAARVEYDSVTEGLSDINFHLPLFLLLLVMTALSLPSVVTWAKNYHVSRTLSSDPYLIHATCVIAALGFIWQLPTPRNV
jgi:hypothetical protein